MHKDMAEVTLVDEEGNADLADDADLDAIRTKLKQIMVWLEAMK
jgi:hypothetical protein|tara:strand:- start:46 stop:177 length:132 start_codon:yes stop_codon:yes gene_type:complete